MGARQDYIKHREQQATYEREWRRRIYLALRRQKAPFIRVMNEKGLTEAWANMNRLIRPEPLAKVMERMYRAIAPIEAEKFYRANVNRKSGSMGFSQDWINSLDAWLQTFLYDMIRNMTDTSKRQIINIINEGLQDGDGYDIIIERIVGTGAADKRRAALIARTESNRAMGWAKYEAASKLPYPSVLMWISGRDNRTRGTLPDQKADHKDLNGKKTDFGTPFRDSRNNDLMLFPGDLSLGARAASTCNCRCTISARRKE